MKKALITGIAGQDGSYLAEFLLNKGYEVHGLDNRYFGEGKKMPWRLRSMEGRIIFHSGDISRYEDVQKIVNEIKPEEIYHLATKHDLPNSLENYLAIKAINLDSTYFFLASIKNTNPSTKIFFASSSKIFGNPLVSPQNEETQINPNSLYGISKAAASALVKMYREKEGVFACAGILYNHESPRRDPEFLPRKISMGVAEIKNGISKKIKLGDLGARRDWSFAGDLVEAMWLMLQAKNPGDYVLGAGETHSVEDFLDVAFNFAGLDWKKYVEMDPVFLRPKEKIELRADITKAKNVLGWEPKTKFKELVKMMVEADINLLK